MKKLSDIDFGGKERSPLTPEQRNAIAQQRQQEQREQGYAWLKHLCSMGETDMAKQEALRHPEWGYEIIDNQVVEQLDWRNRSFLANVETEHPLLDKAKLQIAWLFP